MQCESFNTSEEELMVEKPSATAAGGRPLKVAGTRSSLLYLSAIVGRITSCLFTRGLQLIRGGLYREAVSRAHAEEL